MTRRSGGLTGGGVATRDSQPLHYTIPIFHRSRALASSSDRPQVQQEYRAKVVQRIPSKLGRSGTLIPFNHTRTTLVHFKTLTMRVGTSASNKARPQRGLVTFVLPGRPCYVGRCPTSSVQCPGASVRGSDDAGRSAGSEHRT